MKMKINGESFEVVKNIKKNLYCFCKIIAAVLFHIRKKKKTIKVNLLSCKVSEEEQSIKDIE